MKSRSTQYPSLITRQLEGARLSVQLRREPVQWGKGEREALIAQALSAGRAQQCPAGHAEGMLVFNTASTMHGSLHARKGALQ